MQTDTWGIFLRLCLHACYINITAHGHLWTISQSRGVFTNWLIMASTMRWHHLMPGGWKKQKQLFPVWKPKQIYVVWTKKFNALCHKADDMTLIYVCLLPLPQINFSFHLWIYYHPLAGGTLMNEVKVFLHIILEITKFVSKLIIWNQMKEHSLMHKVPEWGFHKIHMNVSNAINMSIPHTHRLTCLHSL